MEKAVFIDYAKFSTYNKNNLNFETKDNEKQNVDTSKSFTEGLIYEYFNRSDIHNFLTNEELRAITYNPNKKYSKFIELEGSTHDGTFLFVYENCLQALNIMYNYFYDNKSKIKSFEFGNLEIKSDHGTKDINGMRILGQSDVIKIPVDIQFK